jgi:group I intron endonuclease
MSEVTIQRMKEAHQGEKHPLFGNGHLVSGEKNPFYGKHHTEETKQILREQKQGEKNSMYGKNHTEEAKQNQREAKLGEKNHKSKTVYQYDLNDNFIRSFGSGGEAARHLDKSAANIRACARGDPKHPSAHGFKWSYTEL